MIKKTKGRLFSVILACAIISGAAATTSASGSNRMLEWAIPPQYRNAVGFVDGTAGVSNGSKFALIDHSGKLLTAFEFDSVIPCYGFITVTKGSKYGFMDKTGKELAPCVYDYYRNDFAYDDFIIVNKGGTSDKLYEDGKFGLFSVKIGKEVIPCQFEQIELAGEDMVKVKKSGKYGFMDVTGKSIVPCSLNAADEFHNGLAPIVKNTSKSYIDKTGKEVINASAYSTLYNFSNGLACVNRYVGDSLKYGFINTNGDVVAPLIYDKVDAFREGRAIVAKKTDKGYKYGFIDVNGNEIIPCAYDYVDFSGFVNGLALVIKGGKYDEYGYYEGDGKYGYIDMNGKEMVPCKYDSILPFENGYARVCIGGTSEKYHTDGKWGIIDANGKVVVPCKYDYISKYRTGLALVSTGGSGSGDPGMNEYTGGKWGLIDTKGNEITPLNYDDYYLYGPDPTISEGMAYLNKGDKLGFVNSVGHEVTPYTYNSIFHFKDGMACVYSREYSGYVDANGSQAAVSGTAKYNPHPFSDGMAVASDSNNLYGYIRNPFPKVEPVTVNLLPGTYNQQQTVTLNCATQGATIYYTVNTDKSRVEYGTEYTKPISVYDNTIIHAVAVRNGMQRSPVATFSYVINYNSLADVTASVKPGTYFSQRILALKCAASGIEIYYTLDGSTPTVKSTRYTKAIVIQKSTTVKAVAVKDGKVISPVAVFVYTIKK